MNTLALSLLGLALSSSVIQLPEQIAGKDLSDLLRRWPREYVRWIITDAESNRYKSLNTDRERLEFIEHFWARRDPDPEIPGNEYRSDYLERFAFVSNHFAAGKPGWATDRGRLYLLLGPPHGIQRNPMGRWGFERPSEIWTYNGLGIPGVPETWEVNFVDFKGTGEFEIVSDLETAAPLETVFGVAESPLMTVALRRGRIGQVDPRTGREQFREVDSTRLVMREFDLQEQVREVEAHPKRQLPRLDELVEARVTFERLSLQAATGALYTDQGRVKVPISLAVPYRELSSRHQEGKVSFNVDYLIQLMDDEGNEAARVEDRITLIFTEEQYRTTASQLLAVEESLEVEPGSYKLQAFLRDTLENRVGSVEERLDVPTSRPGALSLSSLFIAGALVQAIPGASRPFQFGTVRVIPSVDRTFRPADGLGLYLEAYGTETDADGRKRVRVDFFIMRDERLYMGVPASHLFPSSEPVGISATIPLRKCTPGEYTLRVRVTDELSGKSAEQEGHFTVRQDSESPR